MYVITVPEVGDGVTLVTLTQWLKAVGDRVERGEVIAEIMTDKAAFDVESPYAGVVTATLANEDDEIRVGSELAHVA